MYTHTNFTQNELDGALKILEKCGNFSPFEHTVVVFDAQTKSVANCFSEAAQSLGGNVLLVETPPAKMHGEEPSSAAAQAILDADLVLGLRNKSMAHTNARLALTKNGGRYLSLPDYTLELLNDPSLQVDYTAQFKNVLAISDELTKGSKICVVTEAGTEIQMDAAGRFGNCCPGFVKNKGDLGSPPDIEANISPLENSANGVIVVDGSIPFTGFGLLNKPITLEIKDGKISKISGNQRDVDKLDVLFASHGDSKSRILAECGVGLNPAAKLTGVMLTDEGSLGTIHFGFGSNSTVGGINEIAFHIDFVCRAATMSVDGNVIIQEGQINL